MPQVGAKGGGMWMWWGVLRMYGITLITYPGASVRVVLIRPCLSCRAIVSCVPSPTHTSRRLWLLFFLTTPFGLLWGFPPPSLFPLPQTQQARLAPAAFQEKWRSWEAVHQYSEPLSSATVSAMSANGHKDFTQHMTQAYIQTMASGGQPPQYKWVPCRRAWGYREGGGWRGAAWGGVGGLGGEGAGPGGWEARGRGGMGRVGWAEEYA